jgi:hypothetical protein
VQIFEKLRGRLDDNDFHRFVFVSHQIWFRRDKVIFGGEFL